MSETVEKFVYKEFDPYAVFATVTILAKEECVWHLENILESCRRKMVATEAYRNRWTAFVTTVVFYKVFWEQFRVWGCAWLGFDCGEGGV